MLSQCRQYRHDTRNIDTAYSSFHLTTVPTGLSHRLPVREDSVQVFGHEDVACALVVRWGKVSWRVRLQRLDHVPRPTWHLVVAESRGIHLGEHDQVDEEVLRDA